MAKRSNGQDIQEGSESKPDGSRLLTLDPKAVLPNMSVETATIGLMGDAPYLSNATPPWILEGIRSAQRGDPKEPQTVKDECELALGTLLSHPDGGYAIYGAAFKSAMVDSVRLLDDKANTSMRFISMAIQIPDKFVKIIGPEPKICNHGPKPNPFHIEWPKNARGQSVPVFCKCFDKWAVDLRVRFNPQSIALPKVIQILNFAGHFVGVGGCRPYTKNGKGTGTYGTFHVIMDEKRGG